MTIISPALGDKIIQSDTANIELFTWMNEITDAINNAEILSGTGTPESAVTASVGRLYVDTATNDLYYKETGDGDTGWVLTT